MKTEKWALDLPTQRSLATCESCGRSRGCDVGGRDENVKTQSECSEWEAAVYLGVK